MKMSPPPPGLFFTRSYAGQFGPRRTVRTGWRESDPASRRSPRGPTCRPCPRRPQVSWGDRGGGCQWDRGRLREERREDERLVCECYTEALRRVQDAGNTAPCIPGPAAEVPQDTINRRRYAPSHHHPPIYYICNFRCQLLRCKGKLQQMN